jgi:hypothetical protein
MAISPGYEHRMTDRVYGYLYRLYIHMAIIYYIYMAISPGYEHRMTDRIYGCVVGHAIFWIEAL